MEQTKMHLLILTLALLSVSVVQVYSVCCGRTAIFWAADSCYPYKNHYYMGGNAEDWQSAGMLPTRCYAKVCGDGKVTKGYYCGKGKCNIFGCNCDGGCIEGNAQENFRKISGIDDAAAGFDVKDPTTWHDRS